MDKRHGKLFFIIELDLGNCVWFDLAVARVVDCEKDGVANQFRQGFFEGSRNLTQIIATGQVVLYELENCQVIRQ